MSYRLLCVHKLSLEASAGFTRVILLRERPIANPVRRVAELGEFL